MGRATSRSSTWTAGECETFTFAYHLPFQPVPDALQPSKALAHSEAIWHDWTKVFSRETPYQAIVLQSLITLRALIYEPSGAIVAAPTTSLPEELGGSRNWDYRYCWLRGRHLHPVRTDERRLHARGEETGGNGCCVRSAADPSQIQIMYGIGGEQRIPEIEIDALPGYENSKPVRVGNAAAGQLQIDIYGELLDALYQARKRGLTSDDDDWTVQIELLKHLEVVWCEKDEGIWEVRGGPRQLRLFEGHGLGRVRPCHQDGRGIRPEGRCRDLAQAARHDPCRGLRSRLERDGRRLHAKL